MATSIIIESITSSNIKKQKSITDINPEASSNELINFASSIINLTNQSYDKTIRIDKKELSDTKTPINLTTIAVNSTSTEVINNTITINLTVNQLNSYGAFALVIGGIFVSALNDFPILKSKTVELRQISWSAAGTGTGNNNRLTCTIYLIAGKVAESGTFTLTIPESDSYQSYTLTANYNITEEA